MLLHDRIVQVEHLSTSLNHSIIFFSSAYGLIPKETLTIKKTSLCSDDEYHCKSDASCIPISQRCDSRVQCQSAEDEKDCGK